MAMAFQRARLLMRRSISRLPGYGGSSSGAIVLMYGVLTGQGVCTPAARKRAIRPATRRLALSGPWFFKVISSMASSDCSQSCWLEPAGEGSGSLAGFAGADEVFFG